MFDPQTGRKQLKAVDRDATQRLHNANLDAKMKNTVVVIPLHDITATTFPRDL